MEEQNTQTATNAENKAPEKPSYEQLNNWLNQLITQNKELKYRLNVITDIQNKLPWLFKVLEFENHFDSEFVINCADEIANIMTPPAEEEKSDTEENNINKD